MEELYKGFIIRTARGTSLKEIVIEGKGSVIKELRGLYTSSVQAKLAIDIYNPVKKEAIRNGKTATESGV